MAFIVKNVDVDIFQFYQEQFTFNTTNFQIIAEYKTPRSYHIIVRRLDKEEGWTENLDVLSVFFFNDKEKHNCSIIHIGGSKEPQKIVEVTTLFDIEPSLEKVVYLPRHQMMECPDAQGISRIKFNEMFETDIVVLPSSMYAFGLKDKIPYVYNETYSHFYNVIHIAKYILSVALTSGYDHFYFVISSCDGYMEICYNHERYIPKFIKEEECNGMYLYNLEKNDEFAMYHKKGFILAQSHHLHMPFALDIVDRHYFYHNLYNSFRSFHCGIPFSLKQPKIVFGGQERGYKENFLHRRDISLTPREFFHGLSKEKNIVSGGWIDRKDMIHYKYILDIDGNSSTWDATAWKLNSGSVIFKSQSVWRQWFYDEYIANVHFIEIKDDFSDIQEKYKWCEEHEPECLEMIRRCKELFQKVYKFQNVLEHTKKIIETIL